MIEGTRGTLRHGSIRAKPGRPADHRCAACGIRVPDPADDEAHVCVPDPTGPTTYREQKWRATTARAARKERETRAGGPP